LISGHSRAVDPSLADRFGRKNRLYPYRISPAVRLSTLSAIPVPGWTIGKSTARLHCC